MNTHTIHIKTENHTWLEEELEKGNFIDRSDLFEQALNMLRMKNEKTNSAKDILQQNISTALAQSQNEEFSHRNIDSISKGIQLCAIDNIARPYQMTTLADTDIEHIFTCKLTISGMTIAQRFLQKLETAFTGLPKIEEPMKLNKLLPVGDHIYYSKMGDVYIIFTKSGQNVNILTVYQTLLIFEARISR